MTTPSAVPLIALVGRTNVGKSTLFNRVTDSHKALVSPVAGTTRDRLEGECLWRGRIVRFTDTGGLDVDTSGEIERNVVRQAEIAMEKADIICFVVDLKSGAMPQERELAKRLVKSNKPVIVVGNKAETISAVTTVHNREWQFPGLPAPLAVSALKGTGVGDLLDQVYDQLKKMGKPPADISQVHGVRVSVIGKPNVGKSSLLNAILGEERFIVSPIAGTTREPNDVKLAVGDRNYVFVDTAGMRKKSKVRGAGGLEEEGVERAASALRRCDVALFVVDATQPLGAQERTLAGLLQEAHVGVIIVANKWDLVPNKKADTINAFRKHIASALPFLAWAPILFTSAKEGQRVENIFGIVDAIQARRFTKLTESELEVFLKGAVRAHLPSKGKGPSPPKILAMEQVDVGPPYFQVVIKAKRLDVLHPSYLRFLENRLRERFDLEGTPVRLGVRGVVSA